MKQNVGRTEGYLRMGLGVAAGIVALRTKSRLLKSLFGTLAISGIQSGAMHFCAVKKLLGLGESRHLPKSEPKALRDAAGNVYSPSSYDNDRLSPRSQAV